jgi:N6-L-threonylcarbamoyladenine synthase
MSKKPLILGIESSCDETAASIITENEQGIPIVLSNIVSSQVDVHKEFGGVVPELAARSHMEKIDWIVQKAIDDSGKKIEEIDASCINGWSRSDSMFICWFKFWKSFCFCVRKTIYCC